MTTQFLLQIFEFGFHGAGLVFLWLGFRLYKQVLALPAGTPSELSALELRLRNLRWFMAWSATFFVLGVGLELWQASRRHSLTVLLAPSEMSAGLPMTQVSLGGEPLDFKNGRAKLAITESSDLQINSETLDRKIREVLSSTQLAVAAGKHDLGVDPHTLAETPNLTNEAVAEADPQTLASQTLQLEQHLQDPGLSGDEAAATKASLGWLYFSQKRYGDAQTVLREAVEQSTLVETRTRALNNLGRVLLIQGDLAGAKSSLIRASAAGSGSAQIGVVAVEKLEGALKSPG